MTDWQTIDTAPKDGRWFMGMNAFYPEHAQPMRLHLATGRYVVQCPDAPEGMVKTIRSEYPTHWALISDETTN